MIIITTTINVTKASSLLSLLHALLQSLLPFLFITNNYPHCQHSYGKLGLLLEPLSAKK